MKPMPMKRKVPRNAFAMPPKSSEEYGEPKLKPGQKDERDRKGMKGY